MELTTSDARSMIELAFERMLSVARSLGDRVAERPDLAGANSVSGLVMHGIGVTDWWLGHEVLGLPIERDRDAEFERRLGVAELEAAVADLRVRLPRLLVGVDAAVAAATAAPPGLDGAWSWTPTGMVLHVIEELFQHAGHVDLIGDLLLAAER